MEVEAHLLAKDDGTRDLLAFAETVFGKLDPSLKVHSLPFVVNQQVQLCGFN